MRKTVAVSILLAVFLGTAVAVRQTSEQEYIKVPVKKKPADKNWTLRDTRTIELLDGFQPGSKKITTGRYGGRADKRTEATGFFYPKRIAGRWWLIDPDGHLFVNFGVCSVNIGKSEISREPVKKAFGTPRKWAEFSTELLARHGFNGTGGWSDTELLKKAPHRLAYTLSWNFMGSFGRSKNLVRQEPGHLGYPNRCIPVFHRDFETFCNDHAEQLAASRDDPWLIGHFSDNELPIVTDMLDRSLQLDVNHPDLRYGYEAAQRWLDERKGGRAKPKDITDADRAAFLNYAVERYYRITTRAIRSHDPHHLCLGSRLHGRALSLPSLFRVAGKYLDVIAVNYYGAWGPDPEKMAMWSRESGRPFMITEFYAKGHDVGLANNSGAGWLVPTQKDRARFYQHFTMGLLESKSCVGWHWFKYRDNNPEDLSTDPSNRDSNKGIVDHQFNPYTTLLEGMKALNDEAYALVDYFDAN
ncbi:MAG: hypothetical protein ACYTEK_00815 [Planctomycetota bacterium]|jgi:hypothetical protein